LPQQSNEVKIYKHNLAPGVGLLKTIKLDSLNDSVKEQWRQRENYKKMFVRNPETDKETSNFLTRNGGAIAGAVTSKWGSRVLLFDQITQKITTKDEAEMISGLYSTYMTWSHYLTGTGDPECVEIDMNPESDEVMIYRNNFSKTDLIGKVVFKELFNNDKQNNGAKVKENFDEAVNDKRSSGLEYRRMFVRNPRTFREAQTGTRNAPDGFADRVSSKWSSDLVDYEKDDD